MNGIVFYNKRFNLVFYHIPKCGTTSIRKALLGGFSWVPYDDLQLRNGFLGVTDAS